MKVCSFVDQDFVYLFMCCLYLHTDFLLIYWAKTEQKNPFEIWWIHVIWFISIFIIKHFPGKYIEEF